MENLTGCWGGSLGRGIHRRGSIRRKVVTLHKHFSSFAFLELLEWCSPCKPSLQAVGGATISIVNACLQQTAIMHFYIGTYYIVPHCVLMKVIHIYNSRHIQLTKQSCHLVEIFLLQMSLIKHYPKSAFPKQRLRISIKVALAGRESRPNAGSVRGRAQELRHLGLEKWVAV